MHGEAAYWRMRWGPSCAGPTVRPGREAFAGVPHTDDRGVAIVRRNSLTSPFHVQCGMVGPSGTSTSGR